MTTKKKAPQGSYIVFNKQTVEPSIIEYDFHLGKCPTRINEAGDHDPYCYHECLLILPHIEGDLLLAHLESSKDFIIRHPHMNLEVRVKKVELLITKSEYKFKLILEKVERYG